MTARARAATALLACLVHLALFVPFVGHDARSVSGEFWGDAEALVHGERPYADHSFEYPPLALPVLAAPLAVAQSPDPYAQAFSVEMIAADLAIVLLLSFGLGSGRRRVWSVLAVYTAGVALLSTTVVEVGHLVSKDALPLARFDLVPALCVLAAVLAREARRSATWSFLLSLGAAIKAFPLVLFPVLIRGERRPLRVALAAAVPLVAAALLVVALGDDFGKAITYQSHGDLQVESVAASALLLFHHAGLDLHTHIASGRVDLSGDGTGLAVALTSAFLVAGWLLVLWRVWSAGVPLLQAATAMLGVTIVFAPVLSPQYLLWIVPLSAAAYGLSASNVLLLVACALTSLELHLYHDVDTLGAGFTAAVCARNAVLLAYVALMLAPILGRRPATERPLVGDRLAA
jgi:hypothetical protein